MQARATMHSLSYKGWDVGTCCHAQLVPLNSYRQIKIITECRNTCLPEETVGLWGGDNTSLIHSELIFKINCKLIKTITYTQRCVLSMVSRCMWVCIHVRVPVGARSTWGSPSSAALNLPHWNNFWPKFPGSSCPSPPSTEDRSTWHHASWRALGTEHGFLSFHGKHFTELVSSHSSRQECIFHGWCLGLAISRTALSFPLALAFHGTMTIQITVGWQLSIYN